MDIFLLWPKYLSKLIQFQLISSSSAKHTIKLRFYESLVPLLQLNTMIIFIRMKYPICELNVCMHICNVGFILTYCGLVTPYGVKESGSKFHNVDKIKGLQWLWYQSSRYAGGMTFPWRCPSVMIVLGYRHAQVDWIRHDCFKKTLRSISKIECIFCDCMISCKIIAFSCDLGAPLV